MKRQFLAAFLLSISIASIVLAALAGTSAVISPANHSSLNGTAPINVTFDGTANITIEYNTTGAYTLLNSSQDQTSSFLFSWNTTSVSDGVYNLRINMTNSTNATDSETLHVANITIDNTAPAVTLNSPANNSNSSSSNVSFNFTVSDTIATVLNSTLFINGTANQSISGNGTIVLSGLFADGTYSWYVNSTDDVGNTQQSATRTFTIDTAAPELTLNSPEDGHASTSSNVSFNVSVSDSTSASTTLYINDTENETAAGEGTLILSSLFADGTYSWYVNSTDSAGNVNVSATRNFTVDTGIPGITGVVNSSITSSGATVEWNVSEAANGSVNYGTTTALGTTSGSVSLRLNHSISLSSLSASTLYYYNVTSCDAAGNCNTTGSYSFTTSAAATTSSGGRRGGGGGTASTVQLSSTPRQHMISTTGYYNFQLAGSSYVHRLSIEQIADDSVTFVIRSEPVYLTLKQGEHQDVDIDGDGVPDMRLELISFSASSATFKASTVTAAPAAPAEEPFADVAQPETIDIAPAVPSAAEEPVAAPAPAEPAKQQWIWWIAVALLIAVGAWFFKGKRPPHHPHQKHHAKHEPEPANAEGLPQQ